MIMQARVKEEHASASTNDQLTIVSNLIMNVYPKYLPKALLNPNPPFCRSPNVNLALLTLCGNGNLPRICAWNNSIRPASLVEVRMAEKDLL